jgi:hypothetical protein
MVEFNNTIDRITVRAHQMFPNFLTTTASSAGLLGAGAGTAELDLAALGQRAAAFGSLYSRYRIRSIQFTYIPVVGTSVNGAIALGVIDDQVDADNATTISNYLPVTQLRTSLNTQVYQKAMMTYRPVDPNKWYYTDRVNTAANVDRFGTQISLAGQASAAALNGNSALGSLRLDYVIEFEGAIPVTTEVQTARGQRPSPPGQHNGVLLISPPDNNLLQRTQSVCHTGCKSSTAF